MSQVIRVLGVDGCRSGWVGALVTGRTVRWLTFPDARAVVDADADVVGVDIPIGLPDSGSRECDRAARRLLGARGVCVFPAPVRAVLGAATYADACARSRVACGRGLSRQTWSLLPKIADWDEVVAAGMQRRVVEVHPEVSYAVCAGRALPPKRSSGGPPARLAALAGWRPALADALDERPPGVAAHDALDAAVAAWSAARWLRGQAVVLPLPDPPRDHVGRYLEIVA